MIGELTNHLWQSTLFVMVAGLMTVALRKNRAQIRYWLWFSASFKFLIPFSLLMGLGSHLVWAPAAKRMATQAVSGAMVQIAQPFPDTLPLTPGAVSWMPTAIFGVWVCGVGLIALMRLRGWLRVRDAVRSSVPLELPTAIEARSSPGLLEPGVVGILHPVLLLPAGIVERLTPRQLETVLAHELCHVRRRDNLTAAIHMIVEALFWFHPLVWWIGARLVEERERACDEDVLRLGGEPEVYAEAILSVCKYYVESPLACVSGITGSDLKKRIEAIMAQHIARNLNLTRKLLLTVGGIAAVIAPVAIGLVNVPTRGRAQSQTGVPSSRPEFEVASVKVSKSSASDPAVRITPGRFNVENLTLRRLIFVAYKIRDFQISGGPGWIDSERFDIEAKTAGASGADLMLLMLQTLLEDRFQLGFHRETKDGPVYVLTIAKNGVKMHEVSCVPFDPNNLPKQVALPDQERVSQCGGINRHRDGLDGNGMTMEDSTGPAFQSLAGQLSLVLDRPVINRTGLTGRFDVHLRWTSDQATTDPPSTGPSIFSALQEQLGLKLEAGKGPVEKFVIDHAEKPSAN